MAEARGKTIQVRVSDAEKAQIQERAVAAGMKVSDYVRVRALGRRLRSSSSPPSNEGAKPEHSHDPPAQTAATVPDIEVAAEVEEAKMPDEAAREAFVERRTKQLIGRGRTSIVARREAEAEWKMRGA